MTQNSFGPLSAADLEANKAGRLTDSQRKLYRSQARAFRKNELVGAVMAAVVAALLLTSTGPAPNAWLRPVAGAGLIVLAVFLLLRATVLGDSLTWDLRSGSVETIDGAIGKHTQSGREITFHYLDIAGKRFEVSRATYDACPEAGWVKLYVLPRSHKVVNLERLPDRPIPAGSLDSPGAAVGEALSLLRSPDPTQVAEARAEMSAMGNAWNAERARQGTRPSADQLDPRPLAEAILGTWRMGPTSVSFMPNGTMVATLPGGRQQQGRWSIGADGRLHADAPGLGQAAEAWVAGDTLTVAENGQGLSFKRATGA